MMVSVLKFYFYRTSTSREARFPFDLHYHRIGRKPSEELIENFARRYADMSRITANWEILGLNGFPLL